MSSESGTPARRKRLRVVAPPADYNASLLSDVGIDFTKKTATVDQGANAIKQALEKEPEDAKAEDIREEQPRHDASPDHADDDPEEESSCAAVKSG
ncbi:hypothetical protein BGZ61DRAFT_534877 [Ilyonectria robusta]|uniref:uncharacterized protein n=1 Tax=Ilyonectria robusta TaxID=1079257 RepID=UPI001E8CC2D2|nr:uncharacterized protein BGZ61DRAFT_534877 [Ilyonectria robusta]KAH8683418.1 hypothetical protein BGZ61DRAFT_534877 [Ilyonectria robusta]